MSVCGQSPLYVPTTINAVLRNIDAVDCAATNVSCKNLTVNGEPISGTIQNMGGSTAGNTIFNGTVNADTFKTTGVMESLRIQTGTVNTTTVNAAEVDVSSDLSNLGTLTQTGAATFGTNITQNAGTASLKALTATSISNSGTLTQTGAATFATNITQSAGTTSLKSVTCDTIKVNNLQFDAMVVDTIAGNTDISCIYSVGRYTLGTNVTSTTTAFETLKNMTTVQYGLMSSKISYTASTGVFTNISGKTIICKVAYNLKFGSTNKGYQRDGRIRRASDTDVLGESRFSYHYTSLDPTDPTMSPFLYCMDIVSLTANATFTVQYATSEAGVVVGLGSYILVECLA